MGYSNYEMIMMVPHSFYECLTQLLKQTKPPGHSRNESPTTSFESVNIAPANCYGYNNVFSSDIFVIEIYEATHSGHLA